MSAWIPGRPAHEGRRWALGGAGGGLRGEGLRGGPVPCARNGLRNPSEGFGGLGRTLTWITTMPAQMRRSNAPEGLRAPRGPRRPHLPLPPSDNFRGGFQTRRRRRGGRSWVWVGMPDGPGPGPGSGGGLRVRWGAREFEVAGGGDVGALKREIARETGVEPKRQKLLGLRVKSGAALSDATSLGDVVVRGKKIMMMGSPETAIAATLQHEETAAQEPDLEDDFEPEESVALAVAERPENKEKLSRRLAAVQPKLLAEPRPGKNLLVLDIDYTLFDHRSTAERPLELRRPFLLEFLESAYHHYDIVIWSATGMKWVELKMKELEVLAPPPEFSFKILTLLDSSSMVTVHSERYGVVNCKPLAFIWDHPVFKGHYGARNTIMFDDISRNFLMNPGNGLKIRPFKNAHQLRHTDTELQKLSTYLELISTTVDDFSSLRHRRWERFLEKRTAVRKQQGEERHGHETD